MAIGDWQISPVASLLVSGDLALQHASRSLKVAKAQRWDGWLLTSLHADMANTCAVYGNDQGRTLHVQDASALLAREDRKFITDQLQPSQKLGGDQAGHHSEISEPSRVEKFSSDGGVTVTNTQP